MSLVKVILTGEELIDDNALNLSFDANVVGSGAAEWINLTNPTDDLVFGAGDDDQVSLALSLEQYEIAASGNQLTLTAPEGNTIVINISGTSTLQFSNGAADLSFGFVDGAPQLTLGNAVIADGTTLTDYDAVELTQGENQGDPGETFTLNASLTSTKSFVWDGVDTTALEQLLDYAKDFDGDPNDGDSSDGSIVADLGDTQAAIDLDIVSDDFDSDYLENLIAQYDKFVTEVLVFNPVVLTTTQSEGVLEDGFTAEKDDVILAGTSYDLQSAYIDGGDGWDMLSVEMKGAFAQPTLLDNIEEIRVENVKNYYSTGVADYWLDLLGDAINTDESILDLSKAIDLCYLQITESMASDEADAGLTILGIQNYASAKLLGGFNEDVTLHYTYGQGNMLSVDLTNVTFDDDATFTIAHNVGAMTIWSGGFSNILENVNFGNYFQELYVEGEALLAIEGDLDFAWDEAFIDASYNTGGLRVSVNNLNGNNDLEDVTIYGSQADDVITLKGTEDGALITIQTNAGDDTLILDGNVDAGLGSTIGGDALTIEIDNNGIDNGELANLTFAELSAVESILINDGANLVINQAQFAILADIIAPVHRDNVDLHIVISQDATLSELVDLTTLNSDVKLNFIVQRGATLTLTAEELHTYVAEDGIVLGPDNGNPLQGQGSVVITDAGLNFDYADTGFVDDPEIPYNDGGTLVNNWADDANLTIITTEDGFNRPSADEFENTLTIDSTDAAITVDANFLGNNDDYFSLNVDTLIMKGVNDITFTAPIEFANDNFTIDFSELDADLLGGGDLDYFTITNFDDITVGDADDWGQIIGNAGDYTVTDPDTGEVSTVTREVRIDVEINGDVAAEGNENGLKSEGVQTYVVTETIYDANPNIFYVCDNTQDLEVLGMQKNAGKIVVFDQVKWGVTFLMEGDGKADWDELSKADANPNQSNIGYLAARYFLAEGGADAVVNINNQGVELGETSTGETRELFVDGIDIALADTLTVNIEDGDAQLAVVILNDLTDLIFDSADDVNLVMGVSEDNDWTTLDTLDASAVDEDMILTIDDNQPVDLSDTLLTDIDGVVMQENSELTLTIEQIEAIDVDNFSIDFEPEADGDNHATLNIGNFGTQEFDVDTVNLPEGVDLGTVTIAAGEISLHADTNLAGATQIIVPEGTILTMTAAQYMQIVENDNFDGFDGLEDENGDMQYGTLNLIDLSGEQVLDDEGVAIEGTFVSEIDLSDIPAEMAGSLTLDADIDVLRLDNDADLGMALLEQAVIDDEDADLIYASFLADSDVHELTGEVQGFSIILGDGQEIIFRTPDQAHNRVIEGTDSMVKFEFSLGDLTNDTHEINFNDGVNDNEMAGINTDHYNGLTDIQIWNTLVQGENVEQILGNLDENVVIEITEPDVAGVEADPTFRDVEILAGTTVEEDGGDSLIFENLNNDSPDYLKLTTISLTLLGDVTVDGTIDIAGAPIEGQGFETLTINSEGDDSNVLGDIVATGNDLLDIGINATAALEIGTISFTAVGNADDADLDLTDAAATLTVTGTADVTIDSFDLTDTDVDTLKIINNSTGTLTAPGASPAVEFVDGGVDADGEDEFTTVVLSGTGAMVFGSTLPEDDWADEDVPEFFAGISGEDLTVINATELKGNLDLGYVSEINGDKFTFTAGTGVTQLVLGLDEDGNAPVMNDEAAWTFDLSTAATGSTLTLTEDVDFGAVGDDGDDAFSSLEIDVETLIIQGNVDLTMFVDDEGVPTFDFTDVDAIELDTGATLRLTDAQYDLIGDIFKGDGQALEIREDNVNDFISGGIIDLLEYRGIETIQIDEDLVNDLTLTDNQAAVTITGDFDGDGVFTAGEWDDDDDVATDDVSVEAGNFTNIDENVKVIIDSNANLTGLVAVDQFDLAMAKDTYAALTLMDTQVGALAAGDNDLSAQVDTIDWVNASDLDQLATGSVVKIEIQDSEDAGTAEPIFTLYDTTITIDRTTDTEVVAVSGHSGALAAADADFQDYLDSVDTVTWTGVGSQISANAGFNPVTLTATDAVDTFEYVAAPSPIYAEDVEIAEFTAGADNDVIDFTAFLGAAPAAMNARLLANPAATNVEKDINLLVDIAGGDDITTEAGLEAALAVGGEYADVNMAVSSKAIFITAADDNAGDQYAFSANSDAAGDITVALIGVIENVDIDTFVASNFGI